MTRRNGTALLILILGTVLLPLAGCRGGETGGNVGSFPDAPIVVISIDTLRSDHLPAYGYKGVETPAIDALRRDSILYERAYSHTPLTLPSHVSLLTGQLPGKHGVRDNIGYSFDGGKHPYLPRLLKEAGYATGAAVSAYVLRGETGMAQGFDFYEDGVSLRPTEALGNSQRSGRESGRVALDWLRSIESKPFFLFLHLYEPHTPYTPPEPFASRYAASPYDGEIAESDAIVGELIEELKQRGIYDRAVVVLLSDHGEGLGEHGEQEHGILLYREALQVPLLLKLPESERGNTSVSAPAQLADLAPTLLRLAGRPVPEGLDGLPLFDLPENAQENAAPRPLYAETYYPRLHFGWSELKSVIRDRHHYIDSPQAELFDLVADPAETDNVLARERRTYAALRQEVERFDVPLAAPSQVDQETASKLASLGYLGSSAASSEGPLPDPKSKIHTLRTLSQGMALFTSQQFAQAVPLFQQLLAENPRMADAWENLAQALQKLGRREESLAAYKKAMEITGGVSHVAIATGWLLLEMNRLDEAREHAELALDASPLAAHHLLAQVALAKKDLATAEKEARAALEARGSRIGPMLALAQVLMEQEKPEEALRVTQQAVDEVGKMEGAPKFSGLYFLHGDLLARLGREAEAEQAFFKEIEGFPANPNPYTRLAILYASQGRPGEAVLMLRRLVERNDSPIAYIEAVRTLRTLGDPQGAAALLRYGLSRHPESRELRALGG